MQRAGRPGRPLGSLLPSGVGVAEAAADIERADLPPAEAAAVGRAVERRRREFATGRACARAALAQLGVGPVEIPPGPAGEPSWPAGIVGSIAHCDGFRGCAVASAADFATIGIDAEPNRPLPPRVLAAIASSGEAAMVAELAAAVPALHWDRLLFSVKEASYKAWFQLGERRFGFDRVRVSIDAPGRSSIARLPSGPALAGRWSAVDGLLLSAIATPAGELREGTGPDRGAA